MDLHKAIRSIYTNAVSIFGNTQEDIIALDKDQKKISIDWTQVNSWRDPDQYKYDRQAEYPSIVDQLDDIYHNGIDGWKETIKAVKDKYPKE